jgi:RsiW-degrading membrane proteinase PrsW (M82 family)
METLECESEERDLISLIPEIIALLGGIVSAVLIALPLSSLLNVVPSLGPIIIAPLVEEPTKIIGVILLALYYSNSITSKKRGLILGIMAGIGFAFTENLLYFLVYRFLINSILDCDSTRHFIPFFHFISPRK